MFKIRYMVQVYGGKLKKYYNCTEGWLYDPTIFGRMVVIGSFWRVFLDFRRSLTRPNTGVMGLATFSIFFHLG